MAMLILTKLQPPPLRSRLLLRGNLIDRLNAARSTPLILLAGPAGSGKTSLTCQWIKQEKLRVAWYSLDEEDNSSDLFFRYLLTALIQTDQRFLSTLRPLLTLPRKLLAESVIANITEAFANLEHDIHLVLDDFHQIANSDIQDAMARLMRYMPVRLKLVILSRHNLPAPMEAAVLKKDRMALTAEELKFTETETADLFGKVMHSSFSAAQIQDLNRNVEGWAAGLQLIGLSIRSKGVNPDLTDILNQAHEQVANYLIHDILRMQPQKIREFVFTTALLDRFSPELCAEVTGMPEAARILARLERMNLFLIPLDTNREWYRYHHMFSEVVRRQTAPPDSDSIPVTLRRAAKWLAQNNQLEDALRCAFRSNDFEFAADLMEDYIMYYVEQFDLTTGLRWILKLPENVLIQRALLRLHQCAFLFLMMEPGDVKEIIVSIDRDGKPDFGRYSGDKLTLCHDSLAYFKCMLHLLSANNTDAFAQFQALENKFFPRSPRLVAAIEFTMVFILTTNGDLALAETFLAKVDKLPLTDSGQMIRKKIYFAKANALIAKHRGRLRLAETNILQALECLEQQGYGKLPMAFLIHRHLGHIYYLQNRLEKAREYAALAIKHCEKSGLIDEIMSGNELRLQLHLAAGETEQAAECIQRMQALSVKLGMPQIAVSADACAARLAIDQGNIASAELWSRRRNLQPDEPFSLLFATECLTQARLYYVQKRYRKAAGLLEALRARCVKRTLSGVTLQIDILHSAALYATNQPEKAVTLLQEALAFAETEGYIRPFVNNAVLIAPMLRCIVDEGPCALSEDFLAMILDACNVPFFRPTATYQFGHEVLSQREIEILQWMSRGFQNKEIAQKAFISINTVKSHVRKILVKLDVKTRTQAILKAKEMRILEAGKFLPSPKSSSLEMLIGAEQACKSPDFGL